MKYKSPILNEVYVEFYFDNEISSDTQYRICRLIEDDFETVEIEPDFATGPQKKIRIRLWRKNKTELLQLFSNRIAINNIISKDAYIGWDSFSKSTLKLKKLVDENMPNLRYSRVCFSYLNKIESVPIDGFRLGKYINCDGNTFPQKLEGLNLATDITFGNGSILIDDKNTQIKLKVTKQKDDFKINFQILAQKKTYGKTITELLQELHKYCYDLFEDIITNHVRDKIMGGGS